MHLLERLIAIFAPHNCIVCTDEGSVLCEPCRLEHIMAPPERCYRCRALSIDYAVCKRCKRHTKLKHLWVAGEYEGCAKALVGKLKFERAMAAADVVAAALDDLLPYLPEDTLVTHVPTAPGRIRQRGYDQAALIARAFAKRRRRPYVALLVRVGKSRQVGHSRADRFSQAIDAFRPASFTSVRGSRVLLIDDVLTTGATIESAAAELAHCGAKYVDGAVFAQKR